MKKTLPLFVLCISMQSFAQAPGSGVTDYDGNTYSTAIYDGLEWMTENLRVMNFANGEPITEVVDSPTWSNLTTEAMVMYEDDGQNMNNYGYLYNFYAVDDSRGLCPTGWRVPNDGEFAALASLFGGIATTQSAISLKATGTIQAGTGLWNDPNNGTNSSNFGAVANGKRTDNGDFMGLGSSSNLWTSVAIESYTSWTFSIGMFTGITAEHPRTGMAVRCVKGAPVGIGEIQINSDKTLLKVTDLMGRIVNAENCSNEVLLYIYSNGTIERIFKGE